MHVCTRGGSTACMCVRIIPSSNRCRAITTNAIFQADHQSPWSHRFFLFSEARSMNSDVWSSMSGFKEECIDGCFFRATYSGKGGAYDLTAHYSLLMRRNDRAESPMRLCTTPSVLKYTPEYLSFQRFQRVTTQIFVFLEIQMDYYIRMYIDIFQSVDSLILLRMQSLVKISRKTNIWERRE